ncbi:MAG: M48 family metallopeptidase [Bacteroidota bacterium]|nr:M48 family metallopeptidase [Bacteroidota bacterium]
MNPYLVIILFALLIEYILELIADLLNLKTLSAVLPNEFNGIYDEETYKKSQTYTYTRTVFGIVESSFSLVITFVFWFLGGFNYLDIIVRDLQLGFVFTGIAYIGILIIIRSILSMPFSIYSTFVIEEKFGFNKTTVKTFITDILKGLLLGAILGGSLLLGILVLFEYAGVFAWLYCWTAASVFVLFIQFVAPTWIMPLFNKFTPLQDGELKESIVSYAKSVKFSLRDVYVMDGSKRSSKSNAFFTGFGKNKRIALFDTLIQKHTIPELVSVLAHEIGHYKKKHIIQGMIISILHMGLMFFLLSIFVTQPGLFDAFFMENISVYAGLLFFGMLFTPLEFLVSLALNALSRKHEYEADRFAVETMKSSEPFVDALKKLSKDNLSHLTPHPFYVKMNYSHPPVVERIIAIKSEIQIHI